MKKYLSLLLIAIMAVSVLSAAGVVTTKKAEAVKPPVAPIVVDYQPGTKYTYTKQDFNTKIAGFYTYAGTKIKHSEKAGNGVASSSITTKSGQAGLSHAKAGITWQLNLAGQDWDVVKAKPCRVTMTVSYDIAANGDSGTSAVAWGSGFGWGHTRDTVTGSDSKHVDTTTTWDTTVGDITVVDGVVVSYGVFWPVEGSLRGVAEINSVSTQDPAGAGQASGIISCSSVVLEFLAT